MAAPLHDGFLHRTVDRLDDLLFLVFGDRAADRLDLFAFGRLAHVADDIVAGLLLDRFPDRFRDAHRFAMDGRFGNALADGTGPVTGFLVPNRFVGGHFLLAHFGLLDEPIGGPLGRVGVHHRTGGNDNRLRRGAAVADDSGSRRRNGVRLRRGGVGHRRGGCVSKRFNDRSRIGAPAAGRDARRRSDSQRGRRQNDEDDDPIRFGNESH